MKDIMKRKDLYLPVGIHTIRSWYNGRRRKLTLHINRKVVQVLNDSLQKIDKPWISGDAKEETFLGKPLFFVWSKKGAVVVWDQVYQPDKGVLCPCFITDIDFKKIRQKGARGSKNNPGSVIGVGPCTGFFSTRPSFK